MPRRQSRFLPFSYAGRELEARAVPYGTYWQIWIYENGRPLVGHARIATETVRDAGHYKLDLLGDMIDTTIEEIHGHRLILPLQGGAMAKKSASKKTTSIKATAAMKRGGAAAIEGAPELRSHERDLSGDG
jgi:hypothetical protein